MKRRLFIISLVAALGLFPWPGLAIDAPESPKVTTEITPETPYSASDIEELAADLGISAKEAELRLQLERASIGFEAKLRRVFPDTFGGVWLEVDGPPGLTVALTKDAAASLVTIQGLFGIPSAVRTVTVSHSYTQLVTLQEEMIAERTAIQAGTANLDHPLAVTRGNYDLDIDVERSVVVVLLHEFSKVLAGTFHGLYDPELVSVTGNAAVPEACTRADCRYTLRGGLQLRSAHNDPCTSAFSAVSGNNYYLLSAAHCELYARYHAGEYYGSVILEQQQGRVDAEGHLRSWPSPWYVSASILVDSTDIRPVYYHITWDNTMKGKRVGMAGGESGTRRGFITSKDRSLSYVSGSNRFLVADYCAGTGDSGASIFNTNTAYGIHSGGGQGGCHNNPYDYGVFGNIVYAKDALGVSILASP